MELHIGINGKRDLADVLIGFVDNPEGFIFNSKIIDVLGLIEAVIQDLKHMEVVDNIFGYYSVPLKFKNHKLIAHMPLMMFEKTEFFEFFNLQEKASGEGVVRYQPGDKEEIEIEIQFNKQKFITRSMLRVSQEWKENNVELAKDIVKSFANTFRWEEDSEKFFDFEGQKDNVLVENMVLDGVKTFQVRIDM